VTTLSKTSATPRVAKKKAAPRGGSTEAYTQTL